MKEISINVVGTNDSGKSRLLYLIKEFLMSEGFNVDFECNPDYQSGAAFDTAMKKNFDEVINHFKETRIIKIKEIQAKRAPQTNS